mgnify:FL=1
MPCRRNSDIGDAAVAQTRQVFGGHYCTGMIIDPRPRPGLASLGFASGNGNWEIDGQPRQEGHAGGIKFKDDNPVGTSV